MSGDSTRLGVSTDRAEAARCLLLAHRVI
jgi:hypothetical protein